MPKGRSSNQAVKLMIIRDYLYSHTNESHYVTSKDIITHLESKGIRADRKTIFSDITRLELDYGMEIVRLRNKGYRVARPRFEPRELRLMIDSIQSSRFITETEAIELTSKIKALADVYTAKTLNRRAYVNERIHDMRESVFERTDVIHEAISLNKKVSFKYSHYIPSLGRKTRQYSKYGAPYIVSPFALYWNNGSYYLYAYLSEKKKLYFFRIDRMESIQIDDSEREGHEVFSQITINSQRKAKVFDMYSKGNEVQVTLRGHKQIADQIIDAFGNNVMLVPDPKDNNYFTVNVLVDVSSTFFAWVTTYGRMLKIIAPSETIKDMQNFLDKAYNQYY